MSEPFSKNMNLLKKRTIDCEKAKKKREEETLRNMKDEVHRLEDPASGGYPTMEEKTWIIHLEYGILEILKDREETWRLKSKAI